MAHVYRARYVFASGWHDLERAQHFKHVAFNPLRIVPLHDATLTIENGRVVSIEAASATGPPAADLGNVAIVPGLVNAHTHLEFSGLAHPLGRVGMPFPDWIREVMAFRRGGDSTAGWIERGWREAVGSGTTSIGEISIAGAQGGELENCPAAITCFQELIAPVTARVEAAVALADRVSDSQSKGGLQPLDSPPRHVGLSPHAPYTVHADLLKAAVDRSARYKLPLAMHLAESPEEMEFIATHGGPMRTLLDDLGAWDPSSRGDLRSCGDYLRLLSQAHRTLVIHGNYLSADDLEILANHRDRMTVVYCPRTHAYFGHSAHPLLKYPKMGVRIAIGTDSRASNPDLSMLAELRFLARHGASPSQLLVLGTLCGSLALGLDPQGALSPGSPADFAVVALPDAVDDPYEALFASDMPVLATYLAGKRFDFPQRE